MQLKSRQAQYLLAKMVFEVTAFEVTTLEGRCVTSNITPSYPRILIDSIGQYRK